MGTLNLQGTITKKMYLFKILTKNNSKRSIEFLIGNYFDNE